MSEVTQCEELAPLPHISNSLRMQRDWSKGFDEDTTHCIKQAIRGDTNALQGEFGIIVNAVNRRLDVYLRPRGITGPSLEIEVMEFLEFAFRWPYDDLESAWEDCYTKEGAVYDSKHNLALL